MTSPSPLNYVGPPTTSGRDVATRSYVDDQQQASLTHQQASDRVDDLLGSYVTTGMIEEASGSFATNPMVDALAAEYVSQNDVGGANKLVPLNSSGRIDPQYISGTVEAESMWRSQYSGRNYNSYNGSGAGKIGEIYIPSPGAGYEYIPLVFGNFESNPSGRRAEIWVYSGTSAIAWGVSDNFHEYRMIRVRPFRFLKFSGSTTLQIYCAPTSGIGAGNYHVTKAGEGVNADAGAVAILRLER